MRLSPLLFLCACSKASRVVDIEDLSMQSLLPECCIGVVSRSDRLLSSCMIVEGEICSAWMASSSSNLGKSFEDLVFFFRVCTDLELGCGIGCIPVGLRNGITRG